MLRLAFTCCLIIVFNTFIGEGNGKWEKKHKENLQKNIAKLQEMAERIEDEIADIYDEYSENWENNDNSNEDSSKISETPNSRNAQNQDNNINVYNLRANSTSNIIEDNTFGPENSLKEKVTPKVDKIKISSTEKAIVNPKWPKFEDILLDIGKKYDWKNDRWIKVKKKSNQATEVNHLAFHERHFSYKTVKLNRSKSRRNVVIAVTAVR